MAERSTGPRIDFFPTQRAQREEQAAKIVKKEEKNKRQKGTRTIGRASKKNS
jgi:hypothetical protein